MSVPVGDATRSPARASPRPGTALPSPEACCPRHGDVTREVRIKGHGQAPSSALPGHRPCALGFCPRLLEQLCLLGEVFSIKTYLSGPGYAWLAGSVAGRRAGKPCRPSTSYRACAVKPGGEYGGIGRIEGGNGVIRCCQGGWVFSPVVQFLCKENWRRPRRNRVSRDGQLRDRQLASRRK